MLLLLLYHLLFQPKLQTLVVDVSHRAVTLAGIEQRILYGGGVVPAHLALDVRIFNWINNPTVYFDRFLLELLVQGVERVVVHKFFLRCLVGPSNPPSNLQGIIRVHNLVLLNMIILVTITAVTAAPMAVAQDLVNGLLFASTLAQFARSVVFHIKFNTSKFDGVSTIQFVIQVVLSGFCVTHHHEHLVVDVLVGDRLAILVPWRL